MRPSEGSPGEGARRRAGSCFFQLGVGDPAPYQRQTLCSESRDRTDNTERKTEKRWRGQDSNLQSLVRPAGSPARGARCWAVALSSRSQSPVPYPVRLPLQRGIQREAWCEPRADHSIPSIRYNRVPRRRDGAGMQRFQCSERADTSGTVGGKHEAPLGVPEGLPRVEPDRFVTSEAPRGPCATRRSAGRTDAVGAAQSAAGGADGVSRCSWSMGSPGPVGPSSIKIGFRALFARTRYGPASRALARGRR